MARGAYLSPADHNEQAEHLARQSGAAAPRSRSRWPPAESDAAAIEAVLTGSMAALAAGRNADLLRDSTIDA